ncbi:MAG: methyltransferase domain-containing protein [Pseudomonadales bacterium]|nr:methyltransferase domain-containing protein [Pseudomonadales bacterium]
MAQLNYRQQPVPRPRTDISTALQRKLNKKLEEAGIAYDKTCTPDGGDQHRINRLRNRARAIAHKVLSRQPDNIQALNLLGRIALDEGNLNQAAAFIDLGLEFEPESISLNYSRAHIYLINGDYDQAARLFQQIEAVAPRQTRALSSLAYTRVRQGLYVDAFADYRDLIRHDPTDPYVRAKLFECMRQIQADYYAPELEQDLLTYLDFTEVDHNDLASLISTLLIHKYDLINGKAPLDPEILASDPLLIKALGKVQFNQPVMEEFLTALRQAILVDAIGKETIAPKVLNFVVSLSLQCVNNEFVYSVSLIEEKMLNELISIVSTTLGQPDWSCRSVEFPLLLISMYRLLHNFHFRDQLLSHPVSNWSGSLQAVMQVHLYDKQEEMVIYRNIERITPIRDSTSQKVGLQYEESPYPRWKTLNFANKTDYGQALTAELSGFRAPAFFREENIRILVAGCGTGKHAIQVAQYFRNVEVTAIDLSRSSLAYAARMAKRLRVSNIDFFQGDILELAEIKEKFHIIECSGVLHHMQDPMAGWRSLLALLVPGGLMKVALYSQRARRTITLARQLILENQLSAKPEHIRMFRQAILDNLIEGDFTEIKRSPDFYNLSGCRDLLFNVQEHQFTPAHIAHCLNTLNLGFLGFVNLPNSLKQTYRKHYPDDSSLTDLSNWEQLEIAAPDIFNSMYQFYCQPRGSEVSQLQDFSQR